MKKLKNQFKTVQQFSDILQSPIHVLPTFNARVSRTKRINGQLPTIMDFINDIKNGTYKELVEFSRDLSKSKYVEWKQRASHVIVGSLSNGVDLSHKNIATFSGWIYVDIDYKDMAVRNLSAKNVIESLLESFPWIYALWRSFSGRGIGFLVWSSKIQSIWDYRNAYEQIGEHVQNLLYIDVDSKCKSPVRKCAISYDPNLVNRNEVIEFTFEERVPPAKNEHEKIDLDLALSEDEDLKEKYSKNWRQHYWTRLLVDIDSGMPILYNSKIDFSPVEHTLVTGIEENQLIEFYHNESKSIAYSREGFCAVVLNIHSHTKFYHKYRSDSLSSILYKYNLQFKLTNGRCLQKNEIYHHLLVLNERCYDENGYSKMSLDNEELNRLSTLIFNSIVAGQGKVQIVRRSTIVSCSYHNSRIRNKPLFKGRLLVNESNSIRYRVNNLDFSILANKILACMKPEHIHQLSVRDLALLISEQTNLSVKSIENKLYRSDYFHFPYHRGITNDSKSMEKVIPYLLAWVNMDKTLENRMKIAFQKLKIESVSEITQSMIADSVGVTRETVNRNWSCIAEEVQTFNATKMVENLHHIMEPTLKNILVHDFNKQKISHLITLTHNISNEST